MLTSEQGADTLVWLATTKPGADWQPGYYVRRKLGERSAQASDPQLARRLWDESERMLSTIGAC